MAEKIGLIQTGGIGDIVIALPIADYFLERGFEVVWPIREQNFQIFPQAKPEVTFLNVPQNDRGQAYDTPMKMLQQHGCKEIFCLYSTLGSRKVANEALAWSLKFDEYKYAIAGVPFEWKWKLRLERNPQRERALFDRLGITKPYICVHDQGSKFRSNVQIPPEWLSEFQIVRIEPLTDNALDWLYTLENAQKLMLIESCFSNLVEQLNLPNEKYLMLHSAARFTPVYRNKWVFVPSEGFGEVHAG